MVLQKRLDYGFNGYNVPPTPRGPRSTRRNAFKKKNVDYRIDLLAAVAGQFLSEGENSSSSNTTSCNGEEPSGRRRYFVSEILKEPHDRSQSFNRSPTPIKDSHFGSTSVITTCDSSERLGTRESADGECNNDNESIVGGMNDGVKLFGDLIPKDEHIHVGSEHTALVYGNSIPLDFVNTKRNDDDDEKSGQTHVNDTEKSTPRVGDRRIRKISASKYCTIYPKPNETSATQSGLRSERNYPIKKRRCFDCYKVPKCESTDGLCGPPAPHRGIVGNTANNTLKLRIKSFKVPELVFDISETATVGSLKRMVLEAVNAIFGGELRVGVLVQGKKVRDDDQSLLQTGVSLDNLSGALGFCLEPNPSRSSKPLPPQDSNFLLPCNGPQPLGRYLPWPWSCDELSKQSNSAESENDSKPSAATAAEYCRAVVPAPSLHAEAITVIRSRKPKRSEVAQRRIRRPFSVSEVEALVQAVEQLGTGRWRDVKLRAFENARHRTYVDLKDKWKTLVHTARISPQQRRGEPVPQELIDRVLTAHAYWSSQQGKHLHR